MSTLAIMNFDVLIVIFIGGVPVVSARVANEGSLFSIRKDGFFAVANTGTGFNFLTKPPKINTK